MNKIKIICVVGTTASGKTELGIQLAQHLNGEIISADSMQIYRDMHIASAAPDVSEMQGIPHHLVEFLDYGATFTVADYLQEAREIINEISSRGKMPIIVGGTGLYISSLVNNVEFCSISPNMELRKQIEDEFQKLGGEAMLEKLRQIDPQAAEKLHANDRRRIVRAFEIYKGSGKTKTVNNELSLQNESPYDATIIGITYSDREMLYNRINSRVDVMLQNGLLDEAKAAYCKRSGGGAVQAIGHKEFFDFFDGAVSLETATENLKRATRRYAKRQLTWFNRDERINWIFKDKTENALQDALRIIEREG